MSTSRYSKMLSQIQKSYKSSDKKLIAEAFEFAQKAHKGQKRASGEEYFVHPFSAALTLSEMRVDAKTVSSALLHDVLDDTPITKEQIEKKFGEDIAFLVEGVSKMGKIKYRGVERHAENLRKMLLAVAQDFRVVLIKLADRYHNLQTLDHLPPSKQKRIAIESLEIYAPLAFRFGVSELSKKIEDIAFKYCYPQEYKLVLEKIQEQYPQREKYLEDIKPYISKELIKENIHPSEIQTRVKHHWSLYKKLKLYDMKWGSIHDLVAMRIIVRNIEECYATLGVIHKLWRPLPGRIKDYIALPKPNGYQSLHTTVFCKGGNITEIQIRTRAMHEAAENGIAAHWLYTEKGKPKKGAATEGLNLEWVQQMRDWQNEIKESTDFLGTLKIDIFSDRIFVFTPQGDVIDLPERATPVDFAYAIHSTVGDTCAQAKINGEVASLDHELKNGDMVEVIKDKRKHPSRDWLLFAKTNLARSRIHSYLKSTRREENIQHGESMLSKELEKFNQGTWSSIPEKQKNKALQNLPYKDAESLLAAVGEGDVSAYRVIKYVVDEKTILAQRTIPKIKTPQKLKSGDSGIRLAGQKGIYTRIAMCCSPLPKEKIVGYITQNMGGAIHKASCSNLNRLFAKNPDRIVPASWNAQKGAHFVKIKIAATDRVGLMQEISSTISNMGINMLALSADRTQEDIAENNNSDAMLSLTMEIFDIDQLRLLMKQLEDVRGVREIKRI